MSRGVVETSSAAADEGTLAHKIAADCMVQNTTVSAHALAKDLGPDNWLPLQEYVDYIRSLIEPESILFVEQHVDLSEWLGPDAGGTADAVIFYPLKGLMRIIDLKFGMGNLVYANERESGELQINPQLALYALGALRKHEYLADVTEVEMVIHQPRRGHISTTASAMDDLLAYGKTIAEAARNVYENPDIFVPGETQ